MLSSQTAHTFLYGGLIVLAVLLIVVLSLRHAIVLRFATVDRVTEAPQITETLWLSLLSDVPVVNTPVISLAQPVRKPTARNAAHYSCMIHLTQLKGNSIPQPRHCKLSLWLVSLVLLLATLAACNQVVSGGISELDGADLTPGELTFTGAQAAPVRESTLHNDDAAPVEITSAEVLGTDASSFALADAPQFPVMVAPNQQVTLKVRFTPQAEQKAFRAALHITGDKPGRNAVEVGLYGEPSQGPNDQPAPADEGWTSLFNGKNLDGWYT